MSQNRSSAVMQQRSEPRDSLEDFPTPPWATRALIEFLLARGYACAHQSVVSEPACNRGYMVAPLAEFFEVIASDVHDYGYGFAVRDYLAKPAPPCDWTITNPPFSLAQAFVDKALATSRIGVAILVRLAFLESVGRYSALFSVTPPTDILQFTERVVIHKGRLSKSGSTATAYCWLVWRQPAERRAPTQFHWIAPCRKRLERAEDYPEVRDGF